MVDVGKQIRYNRLVDPGTGHTVMVPMDHGIISGPIAGIRNPALTVRQVVKGGANAVIFNAGLAPCIYQEYANRCGAIFNLTNMLTDRTDHTLLSSVEYAVRCGADGISIQILVGSVHEEHMLNNLRLVADECSKWGMPLLAMMYYDGAKAEAKGFAQAYMHAARAGAELGADIVKTVYTGDQDSFGAMVESCPVPIVIAGGPKKETLREAMQMVRDAIDCGAIGIAMGRNIWQSPDPTLMTAALADIVHRGKQVSQLNLPEDWV
jgi:fructose-bisphosphate aldolase/2-amino-3,7-dideoxy-D-threo-hept-6-ulosonate synthase